MIDVTLNEEEKMLQNLVRDYAEREIMPRSAELDEKAEFSHEKLARHGPVGSHRHRCRPSLWRQRGRFPQVLHRHRGTRPRRRSPPV